MQKQFIEDLKKQDLEFGKEVERLSGYIESRASKLSYFCNNNFEDFNDFVQDFFLGMLITRKRNRERGIKGNYYMAALMGTYKNKIDKLIRDSKVEPVELNSKKFCAQVDLDLYLYSKMEEILSKLNDTERKLALVLLGLDKDFKNYTEQELNRIYSDEKRKCYRGNRKSFICKYLNMSLEEYKFAVNKLKNVLKSIL